MTKIKPGEKAKSIMEEATKFAKNRVQIGFDVLKEIENGIRTSDTILLELDFPPNPSAPFEAKRRGAIKKNRRDFLENAFPMFKQLSEKRIVK